MPAQDARRPLDALARAADAEELVAPTRRWGCDARAGEASGAPGVRARPDAGPALRLFRGAERYRSIEI